MSNLEDQEQHQYEQERPKRERRIRQHTNKEDSDQFWKNNQYFNEDDDEDSEEYYPQKSSTPSEEISKNSNADDYIDSLEQWEDCSDSQAKGESKQNSPQKSDVNLIRRNLQSFSTMRGLHCQVDIQTLQRLGETSYVYYDEKQTFNEKYNDIFNRFYKSVPVNPRSNDDEQSQCKTEFHGELFKYEDKRYFCDLEILQLRRILKLYKQENFSGYLAYRKLENDQGFDFEKNIEKQIEKLKLKKKELESAQQEEDRCYYLSIDQEFYLKVQNCYRKITPRFIQQLSNNRIEHLQQNPEQAFYIYPYKIQPTWLRQYQQTYQTLQSSIPSMQVPLKLFSFQDSNALKITSHLVLKAIKQLGEASEQVKWIQNQFIDLINALFNIDIPETDSLVNCQLLNAEILDLLTLQPQQSLSDQAEQLKPFPMVNDPQSDTETKIKFFPNFKTEEFILYARPVFEYAMTVFYEIYLRIQKFSQLQQKIIYKEREYVMSNLLIEQCYKFLEDEITDSAWLTLCKRLFKEEDSLYFIPLISLVQQFRKLFYQFDEWTIELLIKWIYKTLGDDSNIFKVSNIAQAPIPTVEILKRLSQEATMSMKLSRIQTVDGLMIIHVFELSQLY